MISKQIIDEIKKACEIESKHQYINIDGKHLNFSSFIKKELIKIYRVSDKNPLFFNLIQHFEVYSNSTILERKKMYRKFV